MERWREDFHQKSKIYHQDVFSWCIQVTLNLLVSCSLKVTQYMHQPTSQLYSIWMSIPKFLYR